MFKDEAKQTVNTLLRVRRRLLHAKCGNTSIQVRRDYEIIDNLMKTYAYASDGLMANFIVKHADQLRSIIPGQGSKCHDSLLERLTDAINKSYYILQNQHATKQLETIY